MYSIEDRILDAILKVGEPPRNRCPLRKAKYKNKPEETAKNKEVQKWQEIS